MVISAMVGSLVLLAAAELEGFERLVRKIIAGQGRLPSLARTLRAAEEALRLEPEECARSWSDRARNRSWLPRLEVRMGTDSDLDIRALGQADELWTEGRGFGADLALRWTLGDVVFADVELRVNRERLARSAAVRLARERVTKVYFERVEVELGLRQAVRAELVLAAARLDGLLVALTGGEWALREAAR